METVEDSTTPPQKCVSKVFSKLRVVLIGVLLVLSQSLQVVSFKRTGYSLGPYPYFILLAVSASFIPIFASTVLFIRITGGPFIKEITNCKFMMHYYVIGALNALNGILVIFSNPHVGGIRQALLTQTVIPWTLLLAVVYLQSRFAWTQYLGAFIAMAAVAFDGVGNSMLADAGAKGVTYHNHTTKMNMLELASGGGGTPSLLSTIMWTVIFGLGQVPQAFGSIYQEKAFRKTEVNVFYMLLWASISQFLTLALAVPFNFIPWFGGLTPESFSQNMEGAVLCLANHNTSAVLLSDGCSEAALDLFLCVATMFLSTLLQTLMVKYSSAAVSVMAITLVTPVSAFAFTLPFLLGTHVEAFTWVQWVAFAILMGGILIYRQQEIRAALCQPRQSSKEGKQPYVLMEDGARDMPEVVTAATRNRSCSGPVDSRDVPRLLNSRGGIITSEYTADGGRERILYRGTRCRTSTF